MHQETRGPIGTHFTGHFFQTALDGLFLAFLGIWPVNTTKYEGVP
jgi:hypothetical protein